MKRILLYLAAAVLLAAPWVFANQPAQEGTPLARCVDPKGGVAPVSFQTALPGAQQTVGPVNILACGGSGGGGGGTGCFPVMRPSGPCR
jgi:hypothetical protein